ncbi:MAG TPA: alpha/beta fold hydrolase [Chitinophagales bacterium]|nr:alpha/beta fold hydrolase [Chitinophagales bacterium]HRG26868.1 alpha/beta fold hydrolase [Chitinophagales bacterium]HRG85242.1 alpha/beta fold hydrolase [Chitinophagales bacterium]HRH51838.1 alpha/beta fold hydrolase [Chitinophagales bacterium]
MNTNWLNTNEYPFKHHYFNVNDTTMHYVDEGEGEVILFVHGTPSWSFEFRNVIKFLSKKYRCIALDHIGFGLSEKPAKYDYTVQNHTASLLKLITHLQLNQFTMLVHDFGGIIGLAAAEQIPEKIKRLIILNTWCRSIQDEPEYKKMKVILGSPLMPLLYRYLNFSAKYILPAAFGERSRLTPEIHQHFLRPFSKASERNGTIAFAKSLLRDQDYYASIGKKLTILKDKPVLIIWGMKDEFITEKHLLWMQEQFPGSKVVRYDDAGHFVLEEKSVVAGPVIAEFMG